VKILIVDDDEDFCELLSAQLSERGWLVCYRTNTQHALDLLLSDGEIDVVLTDLRLPGIDGLALARQIVERQPDVPVVAMTAFGSLETAISAIRAGVYDFVTKPIEADLLQVCLERALRHRQLVVQIRRLRQQVEHSPRFHELLGESSAAQRLFDTVARVADADVPVLVLGESGTGKELVARALHERSPRRDGPFVAVNCAALPEQLAESELFGHEKGAFTDARQSRKGLFEEAHGGTLFLDEIGEIPPALQSKLLRVLEDGTVRPVGSNEHRPIDVRLVCATNRDLEAAVASGEFREDLYFRVNVVQVNVPPLRVRENDVLLLAMAFIERCAKRQGKPVTGFSRGVADKLLAYAWPGNVRELRNCIEHAVAFTRCREIGVEDLPERVRGAHSSDFVMASVEPGDLVPLRVIEERYARHVLDCMGGNRTRAARVLGLDRKTLQRKLASYRLQEETDPDSERVGGPSRG